MGTIVFFPETTRNPITLIGKRAGCCWGADTSDDKKNYKRGLDCIESNHGRTLEFVNIECVIMGYSARVIREWYTHIGGAPTRLQESTRYIDYGEFNYIVPESIRRSGGENLEKYEEVMSHIARVAKELENSGVPREDAAMLLPLGMETAIVDKRNLRNVIDMSRQRMCSRAYWEYRQLFNDYINGLRNISDEWRYIVDTQMKPKCELLGYCPEKRGGCGRKPRPGSTKEKKQ